MGAFRVATLLLVGLLHGACRDAPAPDAKPPAPEAEASGPAPAAGVDDARLAAAPLHPDEWISYGGSHSEQRYSTLAQVNDGNAGQLGLAWWVDTGERRGHEATPIVVDGVIYTTASWSKVMAVDARTGTVLWRYDPQVPPEMAGKVCCDVVNRGVAVYRGRVYLGTLDGRLVALDAKSGEPVWQVMTVDPTRPYSITMAPRIVKGRVILGNGGAEFGVRGYVSAYDAETGELDWRFYTVPGDPSQPYEHPELEVAAKTWDFSGEFWKAGGGGTAWNSVAFDPALDLLYVGTGNGSPWSWHLRSPGGGDNLFLSSILALRPDSGELVWYYQTTPGDNWDFTSTQDIVLAELTLGGVARKVLLHAPKNGFFYVIDRESGELISAEPFATVTWAKGIDPQSGRPILVEGLDYREELVEIKPSPYGAHNWQSMSFSPQTGLVYVPVHEIPYFFRVEAGFAYTPGRWNLGYDPTVADAFPRELVSGHLLAWDPVAQREVWRAQYTGPWNGGTLATAGNLVFQGTAHGTFVAYRASDGRQLWETAVGTGIVAAPVTYRIDGRQYVAVMAGWGGVFALVAGDAAAAAGVSQPANAGRLLVFELGGKARLPVHEALERELAAVPAELDPALVAQGNLAYHRWCAFCHGYGVVSGGTLPDLRRSEPAVYEQMEEIALGGARVPLGMPRFDEFLGAEDIATIRSYVLSRRAALLAERRSAAAAGGGGDAP
jgi:quinohemoprotein ethanol dehydrogenase